MNEADLVHDGHHDVLNFNSKAISWPFLLAPQTALTAMIAATRSYVHGFNVGRRGSTEMVCRVQVRRLPCVRVSVSAPGQLERGPRSLQPNRCYTWASNV